MPQAFFKALLSHCPAAAVVCRGGAKREILYANERAAALLGGQTSVCELPDGAILSSGEVTLHGESFTIIYLRTGDVAQVLQVISGSGRDIVYVSDAATRELVFVNRALCEYLGKPEHALLGKLCWQTLHSGQSGPCERCAEGEPSCGGFEREILHSATGKWYRAQNRPIKWTDGRDMRLGILSEITVQKEREARLEHIASRDMLTGVYNRAWGYQLLTDMLSRPQSEPSSLVFLDLDGLKPVNDTFGHDEGDRFICKTIEVLQSNVRKSDVIFRWGGDEFILILRCGTEPAEMVMQGITREIAGRNAEDGKPYNLSFSYGIAPILPGVSTVEQLVDSADRLMYKNKSGKIPQT